MQKLCETYDYCRPLIGQKRTADETALLPVAHSTAQAHLEILVDMEGNYLRARVLVDKAESQTVIPCSEKSQNRGGTHPKNHPLFDKFQYIAGDYAAWGGEKGDDFHREYMADLEDWCSSPFAHAKVCAVLHYLRKGTLIADLVAAGIMPLDDNGHLIRTWKRELGEKRGLFQAGALLNDALDAFVRIDVEEVGCDTPLWLDPSLWDSYIAYYSQQQGEPALCYVSGHMTPCAEMSPAKIRSSGDKAKLISSNDISGFTYRGRFETPEQAVQIGYVTTQQAHNALKWLIARQGVRYGDGSLVYVAWGTRGEKLPEFTKDTQAMLEKAAEDGEIDWDALYELSREPDVETIYARKLGQLMQGYGRTLDQRADIVIMGMESATTGRLSIVCYEELSGSELMERVLDWHTTCTWPLRYLHRPGGAKQAGYLIGAPSPDDIVRCAYGRNISDKLLKSAVQRLMPCIIHGAKFPRDLMFSLVRRASNPEAMEHWEYVKTLCVACAAIRKYYLGKEIVYPMTVDLNNHTRSYLCGRALAYYDYIESYMLSESGSNRATNALRLKAFFWRRPKTTLRLLDDKLHPYIQRLYNHGSEDKLAGYYKVKVHELNEVLSMISCQELTDEPLDETYLLGYASQQNEFYQSKKGGK